MSTSVQQPSTVQPIIDGAGPRGPWIQLGTCRGFEWNRAHLPIANLSPSLEGLRLLHISDIHARAHWDRGYDDLIARVQANPPDLILFTGDYIDYRYDFRVGWPIIRKLVPQLRSRLGIVSMLGNHDGDLPAAELRDMGVMLIDQRRLVMQSADTAIEFIGLAGVERLDLDLDFLQRLDPKPPGALRIVLSHYPDSLVPAQFLKPDLYLAGHTHGGQICLPGRFPILRHDTLPRPLCTGIHRAFDTWFIVSRGIGFSSGAAIRIFCPSEVVEITITRVSLPSS